MTLRSISDDVGIVKQLTCEQALVAVVGEHVKGDTVYGRQTEAVQSCAIVKLKQPSISWYLY